jgi:hypothetical protein
MVMTFGRNWLCYKLAGFKESKRFFFEKKNQKTFVPDARAAGLKRVSQ